MIVSELFDRCLELATTSTPDAATNLLMHETLVLCCAEGLRSTGQGYGSLFSQVDYLCRQHGIAAADLADIQTMRRHSNSREPLTTDDLLYDVRALALLIAATFSTDLPDRLLRLIPHRSRPVGTTHHIDRRYVRCVVSRCEAQRILVDSDHGVLTVDISSPELNYLANLVHQGTQLNLLDSEISDDGTLTPSLVVLEPDFLLDISTVAAGFIDRGQHPLSYTHNRLKPRANSQAILLGFFAGTALDELIINPQQTAEAVLQRSFREQAIQFCACPDFDARQFVSDARLQTENIRQVVELLFDEKKDARRSTLYNRHLVVVEPSFVCERLGLQGRVDLMTTDLRLLIEQKSGRNMRLERQAAIAHREDHYVQLLLYFGILHYNFGITNRSADIRLLYSKYPPEQGGLLVVNFYRQLFAEAIKWRNMVVAWEYHMARHGVASVLPLLKDNVLNALSPIELSYMSQMMAFVYREQLHSRTGSQEGQGTAVSDLWNMPLSEKLQTGNIYIDLRLSSRQRSTPTGTYDLLTLTLPPEGTYSGATNFRLGDSIYLYAYQGEPSVTSSILYKGTLEEISANSVTVRLSNGQQNADTFDLTATYAIEHGSSDVSTSSNLRSLYSFACAPIDRRRLLLGQRPPRDREYFLLQGPPGSGKTSRALRNYVAEELAAGGTVLLTAYTNRAVDEICQMLQSAGLDYLRIANPSSCAPDCRGHLMDTLLGAKPRLDDLRQLIAQLPIVVATVSMLQARPFILQVKAFTLTIVDEASQILEPPLMGLLSSPSIGRFILVGDHKQLSAVVQQPPEESRVNDPQLNAIGLIDCRHSLFERLLRWERSCGRTQFIGTLHKQGRMHTDVADFASRKLYRQEQLTTVPLPHQTATTIGYTQPPSDNTDRQLLTHRTLFFDCTDPEAEAALVADIAQRIRRLSGTDFTPRTLGIIVLYRNQIDLIRKKLQTSDFTIDTVERYQGSQRDVIIYTPSISRQSQLQFLTASTFEESGQVIDRKLNVAITRARKQLIVVGNSRLLRLNPLYASLIDAYTH